MRELRGFSARFVYVYVVAMGLFHLYTAVFGNFEAYLQRTLHLAWVLPLTFLLYPRRLSPCTVAGETLEAPTCEAPAPPASSAKVGGIPWYDWALAAISLLPGIYGALNYGEIASRIVQVDPVTDVQLLMGGLLLVLLLEATRRVVGWPLTLIAAFFAGYMYFGHYMPGIMKGLSFPIREVIEEIYLTNEGIFSIPLGVSAAYVMIFLIFGGFLEKSGIGSWFMELAQALAGTQAGGPAKIAVVSSCLFGSISGSAVANVYGTGTFTIPLMKRIGYPPAFAGAVEAVASSGGQIMPPVMGAGAFVMASLLGVPYKNIILAAIFPALMYYGAVLLMVHLGALKHGLRGMPSSELPDLRVVCRKLYLVIPIVGMVYLLLAGYTPMLAAVVGVGLAWGVSLFDPRHRMGLRDIFDAIYMGAKNIPLICIACAAAGIVVGSVSLTGFGFKFVGFIFSFARDVPFLALTLIMVVSLILGMGLPTTGAYILAAALGVPLLAKLGFTPLAAHMFVFYFAIISNITPPVALAAYAASSLAGSNPNTTGFIAMRLGVLAFVVPFAFCYDPGLLWQKDLVGNLVSMGGGVAAIFAFGYAMMGYTNRPINLLQRGVFLGAGLLALGATVPMTLGGAALTLGGTLFWRDPRKGSLRPGKSA